MINKLLEKAALRVSPVSVAGVTIYVKEPAQSEVTAWQTAIAAGRTEDANAVLFAACVIDPETGEEALSLDEAYELARGSTRVLGPLLTAITGQLKDEAKND